MYESPCLRKLSLRFNCIQDDSLRTIHLRTPPVVREPVTHADDEVPTSARAFQLRHERDRTTLVARAGTSPLGTGYSGSDSKPMPSPREQPSESGSSASWVSSRVSSQMSRQVSSQTGYSSRTPRGDGLVGRCAIPPETHQSSRRRHASQECYREPVMCDQLSDRSRSTGASTSGLSVRTVSSRHSAQSLELFRR